MSVLNKERKSNKIKYIMCFFNLKLNFAPSGKVTTAIISPSDLEKHDLYNHIGKYGNWQRDFLAIPDKIHMEPDIDYVYSNNEFLLQDILHWHKSAKTLLVSKKLKELLERYIIPSHRFYEVALSTNKKVEEYYILHMLSIHKYIQHENSEFAFTDKKSNTVINYNKGQIKNAEHFIKLKRQLFEDYPGNSIPLSVTSAYMSSYCDIMPGVFPYNIIISKRVKTEMERVGITGTRYQKITRYTIEMPPLKSVSS